MCENDLLKERDRLIAELQPSVSLAGYHKPATVEQVAMVLSVASNLQPLLDVPKIDDEEPVDEL